MGSRDFPHNPFLLPPSQGEEDNDSNGAYCTVEQCQKPKKDILSFDYIPIMKQLSLLGRS